MTKRIIVTLSGYGGGQVGPSNPFVAEALLDIFETQIDPAYGVLDDVFERADIALARMKDEYAGSAGDVEFLVFGNSKGGLVARTLLARNQEQGILPPGAIKCVVTHDSPLRGAMMPLGYQYFLSWAKDEGYLSGDDAAEVDDSLLSRSAQQLLIYYMIPGAVHPLVLVDSKDPADASVSPSGWRVPAKPHAERVRLTDYLAEHEPADTWCGPSFNIGVATGSLGTRNCAPGEYIFHLEYERRYGYGGSLRIAPIPGAEQQNKVLLWVEHNVHEFIDLPKGVLYLDNDPVAWGAGPGSQYRKLSGELPTRILEGIEREVHKRTFCGPEHADRRVVNPNVAFIPTLSALDVREDDPFALKGLTYDEVAHRSTFHAVFYSGNDQNLSHGNWDDVVGPGGVVGAAGAYQVARPHFTGTGRGTRRPI